MRITDLHLTASDLGVTNLTLTSSARSSDGDSAFVKQARRELAEYFTGKRTAFTFPFDLAGTPFQRSVWKALLRVPYGATMTYGELAKKIGRPRAVRAVASAVARNPIGIVIPCHRIVPATGPQPGKYAWGAAKKRWLLALERGAA